MENDRAREVERRYNIRNGQAKHILRQGLHRYAQLTGVLAIGDEMCNQTGKFTK